MQSCQYDPFSLYLMRDVPLNWAYQEVQFWWKVIEYKMVLSRVFLCKCLTKLKDNCWTDAVFLMFSIWIFTLIRLKPANVAQTCCSTPKKMEWAFSEYIVCTRDDQNKEPWTHQCWNVSFGANFTQLSLSLFMRSRNLENVSIGSKFALSATCKLGNIVSKQSRLMAALTNTLWAYVLSSPNMCLLGTET